ncbi:MAG: DUF5908 family protein [Paracoccaceae bacterium]
MPVEIRELVLRAQITTPHPAGAHQQAAETERLRAEIKAMIEQQLRHALRRTSCSGSDR